MTPTQQSIEVVIPVAEGQITDLAMRRIAAPLGKALGCEIVLRNDGSNAGVNACRSVASAACDGRTLLVATTGTHVASPALQTDLPYDTVRDFVPVGFIGYSPWLLVVSKECCLQSLADFLTWLASTPTARAGYYSASAKGCLVELVSRASAKIDMSKYGSGHEAIDALAKGNIDFAFLDMVTARDMVMAGRCRALAVSSYSHTSLWPELPPIGSILNGFELTSWAMLVGPAALTSSLVKELNAGVVKAISDPATHLALSAIGFEPRGWEPRRLSRFVDEEVNAWKGRSKTMPR